MPSFDVVSKLDLAEVDNALAGMSREIATRFDFKGSACSIKREEGAMTVLADDDLKLKQMHELLKTHLTRRKVDAAALEFKPHRAAHRVIQHRVQRLETGDQLAVEPHQHIAGCQHLVGVRTRLHPFHD